MGECPSLTDLYSSSLSLYRSRSPHIRVHTGCFPVRILKVASLTTAISGLLGGHPFFGDPPTGLTPEPRNSPPQHPPPFPQELITSTLTTHDHCSNRNPTTRPQYIQSANQSTHRSDPMSLASLWLPTRVEELPAHEHNRSNLLLRCTAGRRTLHSDHSWRLPRPRRVAPNCSS